MLRGTIIKILKNVHFSRIRFATPVNFTKAPSTDDSMHGEVVHRKLHVQLQVLPLAKASEFLTEYKANSRKLWYSIIPLKKFLKYIALQLITNFDNVSLK